MKPSTIRATQKLRQSLRAQLVLGFAVGIVFVGMSFVPTPDAHALTVQSSGTKLNDASSLTNGLVGYWTMDGQDTNWNTYTENGRSANGLAAGFQVTGLSSPLATTTAPTPGKIGQAITLRGGAASGDYLGFFAATTGITTTATLSAWIKPTAYPATRMGIIGDRQGTTGGWFAVSGSGDSCGQGKLEFNEGNTAGTTCGTSTLVLNKWYHVTITLNGSTRIMYVNGILDSTTSGVWTWPTGGATVGSANGNANYFFSGAMDDVRIYNRALSPSEVLQLAQQGNGVTTQASGTKLNDGSTIGGTGLLQYWTLDGQDINWGTNTTTNRGTLGGSGTFFNLSTTTAPIVGKMAQGLTFNGASSYITLPVTGLPYGSSARTMCAWAKPASVSASYHWVATYGNPSANAAFILGRLTSSLDVGSGFNSPTSDLTLPSYWTAGVWKHTCVTYDGTTVAVYANGTFASSSPKTVNTTQNLAYIGRQVNNGEYWDGSIDDVRIYNRVLTPAEIQGIYQQSLGVTTQASGVKLTDGSSVGGNANGLITYWTMDGKDTNWATGTEKDESGAGNTGALMSLATTTSPTIGTLGQAMKFNGTSQYIVGTNTVNISNATESIWVKYSSNPNSVRQISGFVNALGNGVHDKNLSLNTDGTVTWYVFDGSPKFATSTQTVTDGKWHHVVGTANGTTAIIYVDGKQSGSIAAGATYTSYTVPNIFVNGWYSGANYSQGTEDEFRLYNRALSAAEVLQLYLIGK